MPSLHRNRAVAMEKQDEIAHIILDAKYACIIMELSAAHNLTLEQAADMFYRSETLQLIDDGVADLHCRSDKYLAEEVWLEAQAKKGGEGEG